MSGDSSLDLQERLLSHMQSVVPPASIEITPDTEIFATGLFDSLALMELILWVETELERPLDPEGFELQTEWPTAAHIVRFVVRERGRAGPTSLP